MGRTSGGWVIGLLLVAACGAEDSRSSTRRLMPGDEQGNAGTSAPVAGSSGGGDFGNPDPSDGVVVEPMPAVPIEEGSCNQDVDVVFTLDVSGSMVPPLTRLVDEVGMVDAALHTKNLPSEPHYGLVIFVDDVVMMNGGQPFADVNALIEVINAQISDTNLNPGGQAGETIWELNHSWPENSLDALHAAATGFAWRPADTTLRTIIHLTDASFWDGANVSSAAGDPMKLEPPGGCSVSQFSYDPKACTMVRSVHGYQETIDTLRAQSIWTNTFSALTGGPPPTGYNGATAPPSHGQYRGVAVDVSFGFQKPYNGMNPIAESTGGQAWNIDDVFDGVISLAEPIQQAIVDRQCTTYPPPPSPPE